MDHGRESSCVSCIVSRVQSISKHTDSTTNGLLQAFIKKNFWNQRFSGLARYDENCPKCLVQSFAKPFHKFSSICLEKIKNSINLLMLMILTQKNRKNHVILQDLLWQDVAINFLANVQQQDEFTGSMWDCILEKIYETKYWESSVMQVQCKLIICRGHITVFKGIFQKFCD